MSTDGPVVVDEVIGRFAGASNLTLLGLVGKEAVVYKPTAGVRPLWDFAPGTLAQREVLTFRVSEAMRLSVVPETRLGRGPLGPGAVQRYIPPRPDFDPVPLLEQPDAVLWPVALLDLLTNNADRKAGHLVAEAGTGRLWAIDHGLTFHPEPRLRTVLWGFARRPLPPALTASLNQLQEALDNGLAREIATGLGEAEAAALRRRLTALQRHPVHPAPPRHRPPLPWPPF